MGDLLTVGSDVLDGGCTDRAGDPGEAFDTHPARGKRIIDEVIPHVSGGHCHGRSTTRVLGLNCDTGADVSNDNAGKWCILRNDVGPTSDDKEWEPYRVCVGDHVNELLLCCGIHVSVDWSPHAQCGEVSEGSRCRCAVQDGRAGYGQISHATSLPGGCSVPDRAGACLTAACNTGHKHRQDSWDNDHEHRQAIPEVVGKFAQEGWADKERRVANGCHHSNSSWSTDWVIACR